MKSDRTHITIILDRTGSMESIRDDTIGGFNTFLEAQQRQPGAATLTLVQFDSQDPFEVVHRFRPVAEVPPLTHATYVPRASTPLLDALGRGINDIEQGLAALPKKDRPAKVIVAVITDGQENASREFRREQVKTMIEDKTKRCGWQFVFLSAGFDAVRDARSVGIRADAVLVFEKTGRGTADSWSLLTDSTTAYRAKGRPMGFRPSNPDTPTRPPRTQEEAT